MGRKSIKKRVDFKDDPIARENALRIRQALIKQGLREPQLSFALAQAAHESAGFKSIVSQENNNYSGIKWDSKLNYLNKFPKGRRAPNTGGDDGNYVNFPTIDDWAKVFVGKIGDGKYLSNNRGGTGTPISAPDITSYVSRLSKNGYFGQAESDYLKAIMEWNSQLANLKISEGSIGSSPPDFQKLMENIDVNRKVADDLRTIGGKINVYIRRYII